MRHTTYYLIDGDENLLCECPGFNYCEALEYADEIGAAYVLDENEYEDLLNGIF